MTLINDKIKYQVRSYAGAASSPVTWTPMDGKNMMAVDLPQTDKEYKNVEALFRNSSGGSYKISWVSIDFCVLICLLNYIDNIQGGSLSPFQM